MKKLISGFVLLLSLAVFHLCQAAGTIEFIEGNVTINNYKNEMRVPLLNEKVDVGDTINTGANGEVHIVTDDQGLIAVRPKTQLQFDTYQAEGRDDDSIVLRLLRGTFRSITGWVAKRNPQHYQIKTATATIGVRGTDHEPFVIEDGAEAGTYDKVNEGGTTIDSAIGKVDVDADHVGFAPKNAAHAPAILEKTPEFFQPTRNEKSIELKKSELEKSRENSLQLKQQDNLKRGGGVSGAPKIGDMADQRNAILALEELFRYYETGNVNFIRNRLDPSMIGFQHLLDGIATETNQCKQMRIRLYDTQVQAGPDLAVIQTNWEKRCLMLPAFTPRIDSGFSTFLMHKAKTGWGMAALSGNNPFESSGTTATLSVANGISCSVIQGMANGATLMSFSIMLNDPDLAGTGNVSVKLHTAQGDNETVTLNAAGGGLFTVNTLLVNKSAPISNNGVLDILPIPQGQSFVCPSVSVMYLDTTTQSGMPQTVQSTVAIP